MNRYTRCLHCSSNIFALFIAADGFHAHIVCLRFIQSSSCVCGGIGHGSGNPSESVMQFVSNLKVTLGGHKRCPRNGCCLGSFIISGRYSGRSTTCKLNILIRHFRPVAILAVANRLHLEGNGVVIRHAYHERIGSGSQIGGSTCGGIHHLDVIAFRCTPTTGFPSEGECFNI